MGERANDGVAEGSSIVVFTVNPENVNSRFLRNVGKLLSDGIMTVSFIAPDLRGSELSLTLRLLMSYIYIYIWSTYS